MVRIVVLDFSNLPILYFMGVGSRVICVYTLYLCKEIPNPFDVTFWSQLSVFYSHARSLPRQRIPRRSQTSRSRTCGFRNPTHKFRILPRGFRNPSSLFFVSGFFYLNLSGFRIISTNWIPDPMHYALDFGYSTNFARFRYTNKKRVLACNSF